MSISQVHNYSLDIRLLGVYHKSKFNPHEHFLIPGHLGLSHSFR
jgi:hypothetical protein